MRHALMALGAVLALAAAASFDACNHGEEEFEPTPPPFITVLSEAFEDGRHIPVRYTCDGDDLSPALTWYGAPPGTVTFAIVVSDPDAPHRTFIHGIAFDIPATVTELAPGEFVPPGAIGGSNDFRTIGYGGPCPPEGDEPHRYEFRVYALDTALALEGEVVFSTLEEAMEGHELATGVLTGLYQR